MIYMLHHYSALSLERKRKNALMGSSSLFSSILPLCDASQGFKWLKKLKYFGKWNLVGSNFSSRPVAP